MGSRMMVYGAAGYTGRMVATLARRQGLDPLLCGRDATKLAALPESVGGDRIAVALHEKSRLETLLQGVDVVVNAAGPFSTTALPVLEACLRTRTHYLDVTGELAVFEALRSRDVDARRCRVMVMPGVGFDVVASDCLAVHVTRRLPGAVRLRLGIAGLSFVTRGSARTLLGHAGRPIWVRRGGTLTAIPPGAGEHAFDYGDGPRPSLAVSWGDVASAYYSTGIPDIEVYFQATPWLRAALLASPWWSAARRSPLARAWLDALPGALPEGPDAAQRARASATVVAEAEDAAGRRVCARLRTPEAYAFTACAAMAAATRVFTGDLEPGFHTPGRVFGPDFALTLPGVVREDLPEARA